jgi:hypothetical protein
VAAEFTDHADDARVHLYRAEQALSQAAELSSRLGIREHRGDPGEPT